MLGGEGEGYRVALANLSVGRIGIAAQSVGMARAAFDAATTYAQDRLVAGRRIGDYQAISHKLAEMSAQIEASWLEKQQRYVMNLSRIGDFTIPLNPLHILHRLTNYAHSLLGLLLIQQKFGLWCWTGQLSLMHIVRMRVLSEGTTLQTSWTR